ncbi:MAG: hypothetical protein K8S99_11645 [Planctomycetes bacterium]|nr:hypothetical protein [Planctomycetota bacterium]
MAWRKPANLNEWLSVGAKRWTLFLFPALAVMVVVCLASFKVDRVYQAEAMFRRMNDVSMGSTSESMGSRQLDTIRMSYNQDLRGKAAVSQLIDDLGLAKNLPRSRTADGALTAEGQILKDDMIKDMQSRLRIGFQNNTEQQDDITVTFNDSDSQLAPRVVNQLIENYIRKTKQELNDVLLGAKVFFDKETERYRNKVQELEKKKLLIAKGHAGMLPDDPSSAQNKLVEIRGRLASVTQELEVSREKFTAMDAWIKAQPEFIERPINVENPVLRQLLESKTSIENDLDKNLTLFRRTDEHPEVKSLRLRLANIEKKIAETQAQIVGSNQSVPNEQRQLAMRDQQALGGTITALQRQKEDLASQQEQMESLDRDFFSYRSEYTKTDRELTEAIEQAKFWEDKLRNTQIALSAEFSQKGIRLTFLQQADIARPSKPTLLMVLVVAVGLGCAVGAGLVIVTELLDTSFRNADQAMDDLKLPVLGAVSEIVSPAQNFRRRIITMAVYPSLATFMILVLLVNFWLIYMSLEETHRFEQLVSSPASFIKQTLLGRG